MFSSISRKNVQIYQALIILFDLTKNVCDFSHLDCGNSSTIANGQINFMDVQTTYRETVPVTCDIGYNLKGGTSIECLSDGSWSTTTSCEIIGLHRFSYICLLYRVEYICNCIAVLLKISNFFFVSLKRCIYVTRITKTSLWLSKLQTRYCRCLNLDIFRLHV